MSGARGLDDNGQPDRPVAARTGDFSILDANMPKPAFAILVTVAFSLIGVVGDTFLKLASERPRPVQSPWFYLGFALYASTAFGWVYVMRHLKLGTISVVYSVSMILLLTAIGVVGFHEKLHAGEIVGIALALISLTLLMRFA
jgi:small multidrug resistance pump